MNDGSRVQDVFNEHNGSGDYTSTEDDEYSTDSESVSSTNHEDDRQEHLEDLSILSDGQGGEETEEQSTNTESRSTSDSSTVIEPELSLAKQEPTSLAGNPNNPIEPGRLDNYLERNEGNAQSIRRDSITSQLTENRELRSLAKRMDEQDRVAKRKVPSSEFTNQLELQAKDDTSISSQRRQSLTLSQQKRRATYLETGLKPGAFPAPGGLGSISEQEATTQQASVRSLDYRRSNRRASLSERDISLGSDLEVGRSCSTSHLLMSGEPLLELQAYVVPDEQPQVARAPLTKEETRQGILLPGDHLEKPKLVQDRPPSIDSSSVKLTDLLLHRNMLLLIACLICFFVTFTVVVVTVVMTTVVGATSEDHTQLSLPGDSPAQVGNGTTASILPEISKDPMSGNPSDTPDPMSFTRTPTTIATDEDKGDKDTEDSSKGPNDDEALSQAPSTVQIPFPSSLPAKPSAMEVPVPTFPSEVPSAIVSSSPTATPTEQPSTEPSREPTLAPTRAPAVGPAGLPTTAPTHSLSTPPTLGLLPTPTTSPTGQLQDPENVAMVNYTILYSVDSSGEPSFEEQTALETAVLDLFTTSLRTRLGGTSSAVQLEQTFIVSSLQDSRIEGWWQHVEVEYVFDRGLPPLQVLVDAFEQDADMSSFLTNVVRSLGPYFAMTNAIQMDFDILSYGI